MAFLDNTPHTHTQTFVCLDTTFLINIIYIQEKGSRYSFFFKLTNLLHHQPCQGRNNQHHAATSDLIVLTHFTYYFVANRLPIISRKTNKSVITRAHRLNSYHLHLFLEGFWRIRQHFCITIKFLRNVAPGQTNSMCVCVCVCVCVCAKFSDSLDFSPSLPMHQW